MMWSRARALADAILGRVPGKTDRADTATRMAKDAEFSGNGEPDTRKRQPPAGDVDPLAELRRLTRESK